MAQTSASGSLQVDTNRKAILKIAFPITLALIVPQFNFVANTFFLGRLGERELGAAGLTGVYHLIFCLIGNGLQSGSQIMIARKAGENKPEEIGRIYSQTLWISFFFSIASILITYLFSDGFLNSSLNNVSIKKEVTEFVKVRIWGIPFFYFFQMANALLIGSNNSRFLKYGFMVEAAANIFFDYALIFGNFGFARFGFVGAAYASIIAEVCGALVVLFILFYKKLHISFSLFSHLALDRPLALNILKKSSPLIMQFMLSIGAWFLFYVLIEHQGERPLAVSNTFRSLFGLVGIFVWAFANTSNMMVSNIIGQGRKDEVVGLIKKIAAISFGFTLIFLLLLNIFPVQYLSIYNDDAGFISYSLPALRVVSVGLLLMSFAVVWLNAVTGIGNTRVNLLIEVVAILAYSIYVYVVLKMLNLSIAWAWASEIVYWIMLFAASYIYVNYSNWKQKAY